MACELAKLDTMPCIVREMSHDEAVIAMVDSNLQRESILPSEKAKSYKMKLEALNHQGARTDLTSTPNVSKLRTNEKVGLESGESREQIRRYIRLTELIPEILDMVDEGQLSMRPAVELSYLSQEQQQALLDVIESEERTPSHIQAVKLRKLSDDGQLDNDIILPIMQEEKPNKSEHFKIPKDKINHFFPKGTSAKEIEDTIIEALEWWRDNKH
jgi:ParB family chromosome partitioning protein